MSVFPLHADWHSSIVPLMIKDVYKPKGEFSKAKVALCIHNIAFQVSKARSQTFQNYFNTIGANVLPIIGRGGT